jgi:hypothetical protein
MYHYTVIKGNPFVEEVRDLYTSILSSKCKFACNSANIVLDLGSNQDHR